MSGFPRDAWTRPPRWRSPTETLERRRVPGRRRGDRVALSRSRPARRVRSVAWVALAAALGLSREAWRLAVLSSAGAGPRGPTKRARTVEAEVDRRMECSARQQVRTAYSDRADGVGQLRWRQLWWTPGPRARPVPPDSDRAGRATCVGSCRKTTPSASLLQADLVTACSQTGFVMDGRHEISYSQ